jgi:hypothetical protein
LVVAFGCSSDSRSEAVNISEVEDDAGFGVGEGDGLGPEFFADDVTAAFLDETDMRLRCPT